MLLAREAANSRALTNTLSNKRRKQKQKQWKSSSRRDREVETKSMSSFPNIRGNSPSDRGSIQD